jgi:Glycosyl transferase family 2
MLHDQKVVVVLPAYRAGRTLQRAHDAIPRDFVDEVIFVDDASDDDTIAVARQLGTTVFVHKQNLGYGGNQKTRYAEALRSGADIVVMVHPDYQYEPRLITAIAAMIASRVYDVVLDSRVLGNKLLAACHATSTSPTGSHLGPEPASRLEAVGVSHRLPCLFPRRVGIASAPPSTPTSGCPPTIASAYSRTALPLSPPPAVRPGPRAPPGRRTRPRRTQDGLARWHDYQPKPIEVWVFLAAVRDTLERRGHRPAPGAGTPVCS